MQYKQILTATKPATAHLTNSYPLYYGQNTRHCCWIQIGQFRNVIEKQTNFDHRYYVLHFDVVRNKWPDLHEAKNKQTASILLLYLSTNPLDVNCGLPQTLPLSFKKASTEEIYDFINPNPNDPANEGAPLPLRYFNHLQRELIHKELVRRGVNIHTHPVLWSEPADPLIKAELDKVNANLEHLIYANKIEGKTKKELAEIEATSPAALQTKFFKLLTSHEHPQDYINDKIWAKDPGYANPHKLRQHDLQIISTSIHPIYNTNNPSPHSLQRWAEYELIYAHWDKLAQLATDPNLYNLLTPAARSQTYLHHLDTTCHEATGLPLQLTSINLSHLPEHASSVPPGITRESAQWQPSDQTQVQPHDHQHNPELPSPTIPATVPT